MMQALLDYLKVHSIRDAALLVFGLTGQTVFAFRFIVQWIVSERRGESTVPVLFWWLSLAGALMIFVYGLLRGEILLMVGPLPGCVVYSRNLVLIRRKVLAERALRERTGI